MCRPTGSQDSVLQHQDHDVVRLGGSTIVRLFSRAIVFFAHPPLPIVLRTAYYVSMPEVVSGGGQALESLARYDVSRSYEISEYRRIAQRLVCYD